MSKEGYLNIPLNLIIHCVKNSYYAQCMLYCYLKSQTDNGVIIIDKEFKEKYCLLAKITDRTFRTHLAFLLSNKWIYQIKKKPKTYIVLAFPKLNKKLEHFTNCGAIYEPLDFIYFSSFMAGAVITYYAKKKRFVDHQLQKKQEKTQVASSIDVYKHRVVSNKATTRCLFLPLQYLASCINVSKSGAKLIRKRANKYVIFRKHFIKQKIDKSQYEYYKRFGGEDAKKLFLNPKNSKVYIQEADYLYTSITIRRIKKKRKYCAPNISTARFFYSKSNPSIRAKY